MSAHGNNIYENLLGFQTLWISGLWAKDHGLVVNFLPSWKGAKIPSRLGMLPGNRIRTFVHTVKYFRTSEMYSHTKGQGALSKTMPYIVMVWKDVHTSKKKQFRKYYYYTIPFFFYLKKRVDLYSQKRIYRKIHNDCVLLIKYPDPFIFAYLYFLHFLQWIFNTLKQKKNSLWKFTGIRKLIQILTSDDTDISQGNKRSASVFCISPGSTNS